jgi:hypothetical protein
MSSLIWRRDSFALPEFQAQRQSSISVSQTGIKAAPATNSSLNFLSELNRFGELPVACSCSLVLFSFSHGSFPLDDEFACGAT